MNKGGLVENPTLSSYSRSVVVGIHVGTIKLRDFIFECTQRLVRAMPCRPGHQSTRRYLPPRINFQTAKTSGLGRHCQPTGRANARPMTGSAKQFPSHRRHCERSEAIHLAAGWKGGLLRCARNDDAVVPAKAGTHTPCRSFERRCSMTFAQQLTVVVMRPGSRSVRSLVVRDDRNTTARQGFNFQTAKKWLSSRLRAERSNPSTTSASRGLLRSARRSVEI